MWFGLQEISPFSGQITSFGVSTIFQRNNIALIGNQDLCNSNTFCRHLTHSLALRPTTEASNNLPKKVVVSHLKSHHVPMATGSTYYISHEPADSVPGARPLKSLVVLLKMNPSPVISRHHGLVKNLLYTSEVPGWVDRGITAMVVWLRAVPLPTPLGRLTRPGAQLGKWFPDIPSQFYRNRV